MIESQPSCTDIFESGLMPCSEALDRIMARLPKISGYERIPLQNACGRTLHEPVISHINVPPHTNSAVDGYAFYAEDIPSSNTTELNVIGQALAGKPFRGSVQKGACVRIMTGAELPPGLDVVAMQEHVGVFENHIEIDSRHKRGQNIRLAGEDLKCGETVLKPGKWLTPADIGLMASLGLTEINVNRKLKVAIASTGDELCEPGDLTSPGGIYDSNRYSLIAALTRPDIEIVNLGIIPDNAEKLLDCFNQTGRFADMILSTGGVSVGEADFTKSVLQHSGQVEFWKVAIKPGRPLAFGQIDKAAFFGLPGNPVAVLVTFYYFVLPALEQMLGINGKPVAPTLKARVSENLRKKPGRTEIQRGILSRDEKGEWRVATTGKQGSGILRSMSLANAFIVLEHEAGDVKAGEWVTVQPFAGFL